MAKHEQLAKALKIEVYTCDPYRQYLPKGTEVPRVSAGLLQLIERLLNNRPRRVLGHKTPREVYDEFEAAHRVR